MAIRGAAAGGLRKELGLGREDETVRLRSGGPTELDMLAKNTRRIFAWPPLGKRVLPRCFLANVFCNPSVLGNTYKSWPDRYLCVPR